MVENQEQNTQVSGRSRSLAVDVLLGAAAVLISAISVAVAISANTTQERLLAASTWPNLSFGTSNLNDALEDEVSFELSNSGVGPARIRWSQLSYKGKAVASLQELLELCCKRPVEIAAEKVTSISSSIDPVLKAGDTVKILRLRKAGNPDWLWQQANSERYKVAIEVCYCSVLDTCWMFDSSAIQQDAPEVSACPQR